MQGDKNKMQKLESILTEFKKKIIPFFPFQAK